MKYYDQSSKPSAYKKITKGKKLITNFLKNSLKEKFKDGSKTFLYRGTGDKNIIAVIEQEQGLFQFSVPEKKIFTSSMFAFIIWMSITSVLMFIIVSLFLRIQVRSISDLAKVAEDFGKGEDNSKFKPYGSEAVRSAGLAFIKMRERIVRQVSERTQMLAGISHDLRTPLSRMKLEMALIPNGPDKEGFLKDIFEMEQMLDGYISFVSKGTGEKTSTININNMISEILKGFRSKKALVSYFAPDKTPLLKAREQSLKRALTNIIGNAFYYGKTIVVRLETNNNNFEIMVEDDGPGIPKDKREDVFKAFYRIDGSRNKETGGVGLGLAIAKDIILAHGGSIELGESKGLKGLKVFITLPL
jgi:two-component system osmolarity sensor histidine kinase EnvZ